jgi:hypothetical protein
VSRRDPTANERGTLCRQRLMTKRIVAANHPCEPPNSPRARAFWTALDREETPSLW